MRESRHIESALLFPDVCSRDNLIKTILWKDSTAQVSCPVCVPTVLTPSLRTSAAEAYIYPLLRLTQRAC